MALSSELNKQLKKKTMKKLIIIAVIAFMATTKSNAQFRLYSQYGKLVDTCTNTTAKKLTTRINELNAGEQGNYVIQLNYTTASGSQNYTATLQSSLDGINYTNHTGLNAFDVHTFNATGSHIWHINSSMPVSKTDSTHVYGKGGRRLYFRINVVGDGTGVAYINSLGVIER